MTSFRSDSNRDPYDVLNGVTLLKFIQHFRPLFQRWSSDPKRHKFTSSKGKKLQTHLSMAISLLTFKLKVTLILRVLSRKFFFQWFGLKSLNICTGKLYLKQIFSTGHQRILPNCILDQYFTEHLRERKKIDFKLPQNTAS